MTTTETIIPEWTIGDRLAKAREHAGLTQKEMGALLGVKTSTISAWENLRNQPRGFMGMVQKWADICGVDPAWILVGDSRMRSILTIVPRGPDHSEQLPLEFAERSACAC